MRVLVTGLSTYWGGRVAQALEARADVEVVVGVDTRDPRVPLERTEFVRTDSTHSILSRIVRATQIDTVVHTHLVVDSTRVSGRSLHEINVIGTMNLLAAAGAASSPVRKVVLKSSGLVYGAHASDPYFFREDMTRTGSARTNVERSLIEVEAFVRDFADDNPHVDVTLLRFANVLGDDIDTPFAVALRRPVVPEILGFDPRVQFVHADDVVAALMYSTTNDIPGIYNVAGDGNLPWSDVCAMVGKARLPLPFLFTNLAAEPARFLRLWDLPPEAVALLRYGRCLDNTRFKRSGFQYRYTTLTAIEAFAQGLRLKGAVGDQHSTYRYEREVENFFRHSPAVVRPD
ncbi:MAG TPA: NAD-dependent epimerase/dehydratase family protein [Acidimicrobiia bacterium]|nr:NAD-dependent epimerase/dehydratase family protein [Acidimicrobiia bacterium]